MINTLAEILIMLVGLLTFVWVLLRIRGYRISIVTPNGGNDE